MAKTSMAERAKQAASRAREAMRESKGEATQLGAQTVAAYWLGNTQKNPRQYASIPNLMGIGRVPTIALAGFVASRFAPKGMAADVVAGVTRSAVAIAAFQYAKGEDPDRAADAIHAAEGGAAAPAAQGYVGARKVRNLEAGLRRARLKQKLTAALGHEDEDTEDESAAV